MNASQSIRILEHPGFDVADFDRRWRLARFSAIGACLGESAPSGWSDLSEPEAISLVPVEKAEHLLTLVFDQCRRLGQGVVRHFGLVWELADLREVLSLSGSACMSGQWRSHQDAIVLERTGCDGVRGAGRLLCDYWREAVDGLVTGTGEEERLARHASVGHGDFTCTDVLYRDTAAASSPRWAPVTHEVSSALKATIEQMARSGLRVELKGIAEGTLFYTLESATGAVCGTGGKLVRETFARAVETRFPGLQSRDITPLAVYGGAE